MDRPRLPVIDPARCTGCGRCVAACPWHVLWLKPRGWVKSVVLHDPANCIGCVEFGPSYLCDVIEMVNVATERGSSDDTLLPLLDIPRSL